MARREARLLAAALLTLVSGCGGGEDSRTRSESARAAPPPRPLRDPGVSLCAGAAHACLRQPDGGLLCWGDNRLRSLGFRSEDVERRYAARPTAVPDASVAELVCTGVQTCVRDPGGEVRCWGTAYGLPRGSITELPGRLVASQGAACVLSDGAAWCWGDDTHGRLRPSEPPPSFGGRRGVPIGRLALPFEVRTIAFGDRHACALDGEGAVHCWGLNNFGQLGAASPDRSLAPILVPRVRAVDVVTGSFHTCALEDDGGVLCWGRTDDGQLGVGRPPARSLPTPRRVAGLPPARAIAAKASRTCALTRAHELYCWGDNAEGELGVGDAEDRLVPTRVDGLDRVFEVALGFEHTCALLESGEVFCWGDGDHGRLGHGSVESSGRPVAVALPSRGAAPPRRGAGGDPVPYEALACGAAASLPGSRIPVEITGPQRDRVETSGGGLLTCTSRAGYGDADAEAMLARLRRETAAADAAPALALSRQDGRSCVDARGPAGGSRTCFADDLVVTVAARGVRGETLDSVLGSLRLFDRTAPMPADGPPPSPPPGMVAVPAGAFRMGCENTPLGHGPIGELHCTDEAQPLHRVWLPAYAIDRTEVSWADYRRCVAEARCEAPQVEAWRSPAEHPRRPVTGVTWPQADAYCRWRGVRLPTEAEWEKAARGTDGRSRPWGDERATCARAALLGCGGIQLSDVGAHPDGASPYGALDMVGNAAEWVADRYGRTWYFTSPLRSPTGPDEGLHRVVRGGSRSTAIGSEAVYHRWGREPSRVDDEVGFRCAVSLPAP